MNRVISLALLGLVLAVDVVQPECREPAKSDMSTDWVNMAAACLEMMTSQVQIELTAALTYLAMGAHFSKDSVNRPGFANMFFKSATEEREHAMAIINYVNMRGGFSSKEKYLSKLINEPRPVATNWDSGVHALKDALNLEITVTQNITNIIKVCENPSVKLELNKLKKFKTSDVNDYHLVDYLTGVFLEEQLKGQREIAGRISTLDKMKLDQGILGEFLYDKKLLEELQ